MIELFQKKPLLVEAMRFTEETKNKAFHWVANTVDAGFDELGKPVLKIHTLEGTMTASLGDWIIKGPFGEFYPCKPDIFERTYTRVIQPVSAETPALWNDENSREGKL